MGRSEEADALRATTLGERLDALLKVRGLKRRRMAILATSRQIPVCRQTISGLCTGFRSDVLLELVRRMASVLGVAPGLLAFGTRARPTTCAPLPPPPTTPEMETLSGRLAWAMKARGVGAAALAAASDQVRAPVSSAGVRGLLRKGPGRASTVERVARVLGVSPAWLAFGEGAVQFREVL